MGSMRSPGVWTGYCQIVLLLTTTATLADSYASRVATVTGTPGCVAFWDFVRREATPPHRWCAYVPAGTPTDYPLEVRNYVREYWGQGREASEEDIPELHRGPFGNAIRIRREEDPWFRPVLLVPRSRLHDTPLDLKGEGRGVTVIVWAIRESGNHALAGIWHEGTDLRQPSTEGIQKVVRGQRQYALFAGLNIEGSACGHVSENGASSFRSRYALHKCNSAGRSPAVPADSPLDVLDNSWQCFAMTFDPQRCEITGWLNGEAGDRWLEDPAKDRLISSIVEAWQQGWLHREPGLQVGEDPDYPKDQFYNPPEDAPRSVQILEETLTRRVELHEYPYTRVRLTFAREAAGWNVHARELVALRLNPWWYPHGIWSPPPGLGGPFTIGRVIHSSRSVGFTGWIGGVAVFNRALGSSELRQLAELRHNPITMPGAPR